MEDNQKNEENNQEVSETKNNPQEGSLFPKEDDFEDPEEYLASFPTGYRFIPTDEELINDYLKPKNLGQRLPANKMKDVDLYQHNPQQLYVCLEPPLPPGLDHVDSQRPAHTGESSFSKPQVHQNPLVPVNPQPPGLHNFNHLISPHTGGHHVPMQRSNQDLLSTRPHPSETYNTPSWMPGNSGHTWLPMPDQPGFQNVNSQMAAHNTGESYYPQPPISAHTGGFRVPMQHSNQDLLSTRPPPSETHNTPSWMPGNSRQTWLPMSDQPGFQIVNSQMAAHNTGESYYPRPPISAHTGGYRFPMYNTHSHMPQLPPLRPTIPHLSGMFNPNAQMYGNTGQNSFPKLQTNQDPQLSKRPRLPDMHNIGHNGNFLLPELQSDKDFMPPARPGTHYTDSPQISAYTQRNRYLESLPLPNREHDSNEEVSSEIARDNPSQHCLQEKHDKQPGS